MSKRNSEGKSAKGEFEEFRSGWLLQVAADRGAKAAAPAAMVLACQYLNRGSGKAWPSINSLKEATGATSTNTIRSALKLLEERGHARIEWSDGGKNKTHVVTPLVNGKPFRNLKGFEAAEPFNNLKGSHEANPSTFGTETLQVSDAKPFKKLKPNHLKEPLDIQGAAKAAPPEDRDNNSSGDALGLRRASPTGGKEEISSLDRINLEFAEALEAAACGIEVDPFVHAVAEAPPEYLNAIPPCDTDELAGFEPEAAGSVELGDDGGGEDIPDENIDYSICEWDAPVRFASANSEAPEASRKPPRWPDEIDPDAEYDEGGEPIRDSADEEWLSGWPDDAETENAMEGARK